MPAKGAPSMSATLTASREAMLSTARHLARVVKDNFCPTYDVFCQQASVPNHQLWELLFFAVHLRIRQQAYSTWQEVERLVQTPVGTWPRWFTFFMQEAFGLYCSMRRRCCPRAPQPEFQPETAMPLGRQV